MTRALDGERTWPGSKAKRISMDCKSSFGASTSFRSRAVFPATPISPGNPPARRSANQIFRHSGFGFLSSFNNPPWRDRRRLTLKAEFLAELLAGAIKTVGRIANSMEFRLQAARRAVL